MTVLKIAIEDWAAELRSIPKRDQEAIIKAAHLTAFVDAPRWIQWSIRGGGRAGSPIESGPARPRPRPRRRRGATSRVWASITKKFKKFLGGLKRGSVPKVRKPRKPRKPGSSRRTPPAYRTPIDTGDYANGWTHLKRKDGAIVYSSSNPRVKAGVIEYGRRPGTGIPLEPLAAWVQRKLGVKDPKRARGIAYAISKKQREEGRKGLYVMMRARPKIIEAVKKNTVRMMKKAHGRASKVYTKRYKRK